MGARFEPLAALDADPGIEQGSSLVTAQVKVNEACRAAGAPMG